MTDDLFNSTQDTPPTNVDPIAIAAQEASQKAANLKEELDETKALQKFLEEVIILRDKGWVLHIKALCEREVDRLKRARETGQQFIGPLENLYRDAKHEAARLPTMIPSSIERLTKAAGISIAKKSQHPRYFFGKDGYVESAEEFITELGLNNSSAKIFKAGTTLIALVGATIGKTGYLNFDCTTNQNIAGLIPIEENNLDKKYLYFACQSIYNNFLRLGEGKFRMATLRFVREQKIPLPEIEIQRQIVAQIEKEQELVNASKQLIEIFEQKIKDRIARVWGEEKTGEEPALNMAAEPAHAYSKKL